MLADQQLTQPSDYLRELISIPDEPLSTQEYRAWVTEVEGQLSNIPSSVDRHSCIANGYRLEHAFTPGLYIRELTMPAGALVVSKIHMFKHPYIIVRGEVSVYDGADVLRLTAPHKGVTPAGTKRILYCHQETAWLTFHTTDKTTFEEVDQDGVITCENFDYFDEVQKCLG